MANEDIIQVLYNRYNKNNINKHIIDKAKIYLSYFNIFSNEQDLHCNINNYTKLTQKYEKYYKFKNNYNINNELTLKEFGFRNLTHLVSHFLDIIINLIKIPQNEKLNIKNDLITLFNKHKNNFYRELNTILAFYYLDYLLYRTFIIF